MPISIRLSRWATIFFLMIIVSNHIKYGFNVSSILFSALVAAGMAITIGVLLKEED